MSQENRQPDHEFRAGRVCAALWRQEIQRDDRTEVQWSTKIEKRYRDDASDSWKSTDYYYPSELSDLLIVTRHALDFIRLRERALDGSEGPPNQAEEVSF